MRKFLIALFAMLFLVGGSAGIVAAQDDDATPPDEDVDTSQVDDATPEDDEDTDTGDTGEANPINPTDWRHRHAVFHTGRSAGYVHRDRCVP